MEFFDSIALMISPSMRDYHYARDESTLPELANAFLKLFLT